MDKVFADARRFILTHARLLECRLFQVHFGGASPSSIAQVIRAYQNPDRGLGHALEPDLRSPCSQPLFVEVGLAALEEVGCTDRELVASICDFLESVSNDEGLVPPLLATAFQSPRAKHWSNSALAPGLNPTVGICGLLHYQGVEHPWLSRATETCYNLLLANPPQDAHTLLGTTRFVDHLPDRPNARRLFERLIDALPTASFFIPTAPVQEYGLTPLDFAPKPSSNWRELFSSSQIQGHLEDLLQRQQPDGGWPITWDAPGPASILEWRGRWTLDAILKLVAYGVISP